LFFIFSGLILVSAKRLFTKPKRCFSNTGPNCSSGVLRFVNEKSLPAISQKNHFQVFYSQFLLYRDFTFSHDSEFHLCSIDSGLKENQLLE
jgi:hypothetical protein